jgi:hypothetical protein
MLKKRANKQGTRDLSGTRTSGAARDLTRAVVASAESGVGGQIKLEGGDVVVIEPAGGGVTKSTTESEHIGGEEDRHLRLLGEHRQREPPSEPGAALKRPLQPGVVL